MAWEILSEGKVMSDGRVGSPGILQLPESQLVKIEEEYSTEDQWRKAAVQFWLLSDPYICLLEEAYNTT